MIRHEWADAANEDIMSADDEQILLAAILVPKHFLMFGHVLRCQ